MQGINQYMCVRLSREAHHLGRVFKRPDGPEWHEFQIDLDAVLIGQFAHFRQSVRNESQIGTVSCNAQACRAECSSGLEQGLVILRPSGPGQRYQLDIKNRNAGCCHALANLIAFMACPQRVFDASSLLHYHGHGVRESDAQAVQWFERAARQGLAEAQFHLGNMYAYGLADPGGDTDPGRLAAQWMFEAARQGHADAQYSLGIMFLTGKGVEQRPDEAQRWIAKAAAQGHADAASYLSGKAR